MRQTWGAVVVAALLSWAAGAAAQDTESPAIREARQRFEMAEELFERGDYASALTEWERVHALMEGHPNRNYVLYNIARAYEELRRDSDAIGQYERFLAETGEAAPMRAEAQQRLRELRLRLSLDARGGGGGFAPSPVGIVVASIGAAALVAGGVLGGVALADDTSARAACEGTRCTPEAFAALGDAHVLANVADGLLFGGLAVVATGVVLTFVLGSTEAPPVAALCTGEGCGVFVQGRF